MEMPAKNCQNWLVGTCMEMDACLGQYSTQNNTLFAVVNYTVTESLSGHIPRSFLAREDSGMRLVTL